MSGPIVRTGTTPEFWANWDRVFGDKRKKTTKKRKTAGTATKAAKKSKKKKSAKKKKIAAVKTTVKKTPKNKTAAKSKKTAAKRTRKKK